MLNLANSRRSRLPPRNAFPPFRTWRPLLSPVCPAPQLPAGTDWRCQLARRPRSSSRSPRGCMQQVLGREKVREKITQVGALPKSSTPEELRKHIESEIQRWQQVRETAGIQQQ